MNPQLYKNSIFSTQLIIQENVRILMKDRGWKAYDLAQETGIHIYTIRRVINPSCRDDRRGIPSFYTLCIIADAFQVDFAYLVTNHS